MLAAESSWRVLRTEHARLRRWLADIEHALDTSDWRRPGPGLIRLRWLIEEFQAFEAETHRPKGIVLLGSLRGRAPEADRLLDALDQERAECDELLARVLALLDRLEQGDESQVGQIAVLLAQHRVAMTGQVDREETALRSYTAALLTPEEWSAVASSISAAVRRGSARRRR
jgi:hemerythrin-like domain-containing protein